MFSEFLKESHKVESVIQLLAFIVAAILIYFLYISGVKLKQIKRIVAAANTFDKASLATMLDQGFPLFSIPDLNQKQGFLIVQEHLRLQERKFTQKIRLIKLGVLIFSALLLALIAKDYYQYSRKNLGDTINTNGSQSPVLKGPNNTVNYSKTDSAK